MNNSSIEMQSGAPAVDRQDQSIKLCPRCANNGRSDDCPECHGRFMWYSKPPQEAYTEWYCRNPYENLTNSTVGWMAFKAGRDHASTALQSTIAQLQARIAELESGRGEPVAWLTNGGKLFYFASSNIDPLPTDQPLYTAPPAPVAVVLPERKQYVGQGVYPDGHEWACANSEVTGWNACLDATAALNNKPSTEV